MEKPSKRKGRKKCFSLLRYADVEWLNRLSVKICSRRGCNILENRYIGNNLWHLWQQKCKNSCDVRVRVRARDGCYRYFYNSDSLFSIFVSRMGVFALPTFHWKPYVVFTKTTRRFPQNNTSFSLKQHVVFTKTTRRFHQNHTSFLLKQAVIWRERKTCFVENWDSKFHSARSIFSPWNV